MQREGVDGPAVAPAATRDAPAAAPALPALGGPAAVTALQRAVGNRRMAAVLRDARAAPRIRACSGGRSARATRPPGARPGRSGTSRSWSPARPSAARRRSRTSSMPAWTGSATRALRSARATRSGRTHAGDDPVPRRPRPRHGLERCLHPRPRLRARAGGGARPSHGDDAGADAPRGDHAPGDHRRGDGLQLRPRDPHRVPRRDVHLHPQPHAAAHSVVPAGDRLAVAGAIADEYETRAGHPHRRRRPAGRGRRLDARVLDPHGHVLRLPLEAAEHARERRRSREHQGPHRARARAQRRARRARVDAERRAGGADRRLPAHRARNGDGRRGGDPRAHTHFDAVLGDLGDELSQAVLVEYFKQGESYVTRFAASAPPIRGTGRARATAAAASGTTSTGCGPRSGPRRPDPASAAPARRGASMRAAPRRGPRRPAAAPPPRTRSATAPPPPAARSDVERVGDAAAPAAVLVIGSIHGNETAGHAVIARLRAATPPAGRPAAARAHARTRTASPPGRARTPAASTSTATSRATGARGGRAFDTYFPGRRARVGAGDAGAAAARPRASGPALTISYHQALALVDLPGAGDRALGAGLRAPGRAARAAGSTRCPARRPPGSTPRFPGTTAFVVELPAGRCRARAAARHARAVLALAASRAAAAARGRGAAEAADRLEPDPVRQGPDPPDAPLLDAATTATARRKLVDPHVIVEHYTATSSYSSAWNTFASNAPDVEFRERPGVCAHFIIDRDGTIHQLVCAQVALPPHRRAEPDRDRDRARRRLRRRRHGPPGAARRVARADPLAAGAGSGSGRAT